MNVEAEITAKYQTQCRDEVGDVVSCDLLINAQHEIICSMTARSKNDIQYSLS